MIQENYAFKKTYGIFEIDKLFDVTTSKSGEPPPVDGRSTESAPFEGGSEESPQFEGTSPESPPFEGASKESPPFEGTSKESPPFEGTSHESPPFEPPYCAGHMFRPGTAPSEPTERAAPSFIYAADQHF